MLGENGLTTARISEHVAALQKLLLERLASTAFASAELLNPLDGAAHARFLAFRSAKAQAWCSDLAARKCVTDVRGEILRIGLGIYHDESDIDRFVTRAEALG
jgi:selenocysteine lyase/cysteine desulfurase